MIAGDVEGRPSKVTEPVPAGDEPGPGCFEDLCRGPHVPSTGKVGAFRIMRVAGAYHRGDASKKMLQRV